MPQFTADKAERLDHFLTRVMPEHSRSRLVRAIEEGHIEVAGQAAKASLMLREGWTIEVDEVGPRPAHDLAPATIPLNVVYESDACLVVDKPRGLATHPAASLTEASLVNALLGRGEALSGVAGEFRPGIVHRLDKETTGLIVVAKTDAAHVDLAKQIETRTAARRYVAIAAGNLVTERFVVDAPLGRHETKRQLMVIDRKGKKAVTHFKRLARLDEGTLLACRLDTGRTHQIRVHLHSVGHPVIGDNLYAPLEYARGPMMLHAAFLSFTDPESREEVALFCAPPEEFLGRERITRELLDPF